MSLSLLLRFRAWAAGCTAAGARASRPLWHGRAGVPPAAAQASLRGALPKISPPRSFPPRRESSFSRTDVDPRLRGGDNIDDFHLLEWATGQWALRARSACPFPAGGAGRSPYSGRNARVPSDLPPRRARRPRYKPLPCGVRGGGLTTAMGKRVKATRAAAGSSTFTCTV